MHRIALVTAISYISYLHFPVAGGHQNRTFHYYANQRHVVRIERIYVDCSSPIEIHSMGIPSRRRSLNIWSLTKNQRKISIVALISRKTSPNLADCHEYDPDFSSTFNWIAAQCHHSYKLTTIERIPQRYFDCRHHFAKLH